MRPALHGAVADGCSAPERLHSLALLDVSRALDRLGPAPAGPRAGPAVRYVRRRGAELPVWMGIPLLGALTAGGPGPAGRFALFVLAATAAMAHVLLVNDWGGLRRNPLEMTRYGDVAGADSFAVMLRNGAAMTLLVSFVCGLELLPRGALLAIGCPGFLLSVLYSHPGIHLKEHPFLSKLLHAFAGTLQFAGAYLVFSGDLRRGAGIGVFFGCVVAAGHFFHECRDAASDGAHEVRTWATRWGVPHCARSGLLMFVVAHAYLLVLPELGLLSWAEVAMLSAPIAVHAPFAVWIVRSRHRLERVLQSHHLGYRATYAASGVAFVVSRLASGGA